MNAETFLVVFLTFLSVAVFVAYVARRLLRRGIISEEVFEIYNERLDESLHGGFPEGGIFSREALEQLGNLQSESSPAEKKDD